MHRAALAFVLVSGIAWGADITSGPGAGKELPSSFRALCAFHGKTERIGKFHCPVCEGGLNPTVLIFTREVPEADKPLGSIIRKLDDVIQKNPDINMTGAVIVLQDGGYRDAMEKETKEVAMSAAIKAKREIEGKVEGFAKAASLKNVSIYLDRAAGPKEFALDADAQTTILICHKHKVVVNASFKKDQLNQAAADGVIKDIDALAAEVDLILHPKKKRRG